jgi:hypothetical protein
MLQQVLQWMETHQVPCLVKHFFHLDCPGCGLQRSFIALLKGNIHESLRFHPAAIPLLVAVIYVCLHLLFKFRKGGLVIIYSFIFIALLVTSNFFYKLFTINPS